MSPVATRKRPRADTRYSTNEDRERLPYPAPTPNANVAELTRYVAEMCGELTLMASAARLPMLTYLLSMARQEAERICRNGQALDEPASKRS